MGFGVKFDVTYLFVVNASKRGEGWFGKELRCSVTYKMTIFSRLNLKILPAFTPTPWCPIASKGLR